MATSFTPTVSLGIAQISKSLIRVDIIGKNLPKNFLGMAFDLAADKKLNLDRYEIGEIFTPTQALILATVRNKPTNRIIFGVTLKSGFNILSDQGKIVSFYLSEQNLAALHLHFDRTIMSIQDQGRKDLTQVNWDSTPILLSQSEIPSSSQKNSSTEKISSSNSAGTENTEQLQNSTQNLTETDSQENKNLSTNSFQITPDIFLFIIPLLLAVVLVITAYYLKKRHIKLSIPDKQDEQSQKKD